MKNSLTFFLSIMLLSCSPDESREQVEDEVESVKLDSIFNNDPPPNNLKFQYRNGNVYDMFKVDSLNNIISYEPLLVNENTGPFDSIDTLIFKVKNVDSLSYYSYIYRTNSKEYNLITVDTIYKLKGINANVNPLIEIPKKELKGGKRMYFYWGYLNHLDSLEPKEKVAHYWVVDRAYFEFE